MPLSSADNPAADPVVEPVADVVEAPVVEPELVEPPPVKKPKAAAKPEAPVLAKAFTSGNAEVHNLVAEWEIASSNQDKKHLAEVDAKLAALGYRI